MTIQELWQAALGEIELSLSKPNFNTWFRQTAISLYENSRVIISVPNTFTKAWLENKYHQIILKSLKNLTANDVKEVIYKVEIVKAPRQEEKVKISEIPTPIKIIKEPTSLNKFGLNPKYTFENFIVGKGNELAYAACQAIISKPGKAYNPLFIYGGVGLGKTHLLQAIGNAFLVQNPSADILYITCEKFTNDYIQAIKNRAMENFKKRYRSPDFLLLDDIQFMAAKEGTQEEFFHTFNELHQADKQIVMTSDRPPKAIPALEQRLVSRFEWGMIADISQPDFETRVAILKTKCRERGLSLSQEILNYIATVIQNNIRELEGALNKVLAHQQFNNATPSLQSIKTILATEAASPLKKSITPKQIINTVAEFYDLNIPDLLGQNRERRLAYPRQIIMYLMREELRSSFPAIGQELGNRDHTTAMHACSKITKEIENNERSRQEVEQIKQRLFNA